MFPGQLNWRSGAAGHAQMAGSLSSLLVPFPAASAGGLHALMAAFMALLANPGPYGDVLAGSVGWKCWLDSLQQSLTKSLQQRVTTLLEGSYLDRQDL